MSGNPTGGASGWRVVIEGRDIPVDASLRVARAAQHFTDLEGRVALWNVSYPLICPVRLAEDRRHVLLLRPAKIAASPPLDEWSSIFGDAVHNLRAALDVLCWHLAHLDGGAPANERAIAFPVVSDPGKWPDAQRRLSSIPAELLARIEQAQPFVDPARDPSTGLHLLEALTELDNWHKHRFTLGAAAAMGGIDLEEFHIPIPPAEQHDGPVYVLFSRNVLDLPVGDPVATLSLGFRLEGASVPETARVATMPVIPHGDHALNILELRSFLHDNVRNLIRMILRGHRERAQFSSGPAPDDWMPPAEVNSVLDLEIDP